MIDKELNIRRVTDVKEIEENEAPGEFFIIEICSGPVVDGEIFLTPEMVHQLRNMLGIFLDANPGLDRFSIHGRSPDD